MGLLAVLLCLAGFRIQQDFVHYHWWKITLCATLSFLTCSLAMVWNDYVDRRRDLLKGKRLAFDNPQRFFRVAHGLALGTGFLAGFLRDVHTLGTAVMIIVIMLSIFYTYSYKKPVLPVVIVALCSAFPSLFGMMISPHRLTAGTTLFFLVFLAISAREIMKDIEDAPDDKGYKETLPNWVGAANAQLIAAFALWGAGVLAFLAWNSFVLRWAIVLPLVACGLLCWPLNRPTVSKAALDLTTVMVLTGIVLGYL